MLTELFLHWTEQKSQSFLQKQVKTVVEQNTICLLSLLFLITNTCSVCRACYEMRVKTLIRDMAPVLRELRIQSGFMLFSGFTFSFFNVFFFFWLNSIPLPPPSYGSFNKYLWSPCNDTLSQALTASMSLIPSSQSPCQTLNSKCIILITCPVDSCINYVTTITLHKNQP